jgi:protein lifeguard
LVAAILFTAYLIYDLQMLMGGRKYEISPDEYIAASISIYMDIVQIFLNVLQILGLVSQ